jgi:hypothetical protein
MALESRVKKMEEQVTPPGSIMSLVRYECETDEDIERRVRQARGRAPLQGDIRLIVEVRHFGLECPPGKHTHDDEVKVWAR